MQFNDVTPDTLTVILTSCLEDNSSWTEPLNQFKKLLTDIRSNNPPTLPPPNQNYTNEFVFSCTPRVVAKILDRALSPDEPVVEFLEQVIATITFFITNSGKLQGLSTLELIFDTTSTFYVHMGRDENHQYSKHLNRLAEYAIKNNVPNSKSDNYSNSNFFNEVSNF